MSDPKDMDEDVPEYLDEGDTVEVIDLDELLGTCSSHLTVRGTKCSRSVCAFHC